MKTGKFTILYIWFLIGNALSYPHSQGISLERVRRADEASVLEISKFHIETKIQFRYARTVVTSHVKNPDTEAQKADFSMILPDTAFISNMSMIIKNKTFVSEVKDKDEAKDTFEEAVQGGYAASLVSKSSTSRDSNKFTVDVNIEPGDKVIFELTYDELLERKNGKYEYGINIDPGMIIDDFKVVININESLPLTKLEVPELIESNEIDFSKDSTENSIAEITRYADDPNNATIVFAPTKEYQEDAGDQGVSGKFVVKYDVDRQGQDTEVQVIDGYFVHYFVPNNLEALPKHVLYVLDVSGSMQGEKLEQMKDAMFTVLDDMTESDYFNIITFNDKVLHWNKELNWFINESSNFYGGSEENKNTAITSILNLIAEDGTDINAGILAALTEGGVAKQEGVLPEDVKTMVVFLTDGRPSSGVVDKDEIKSNIKNFNKDLEIPIFTIAFGEDADFDLIRDIAVENEGRAKRVYEGSDAALQLEDFYSQISSPLLSKLNFQYVGGLVENNSLSNLETNTFFQGKEYIVAGKLKEADENNKVTVIIDADAGVKYHRELDICLRTNTPVEYELNSNATSEKQIVSSTDTANNVENLEELIPFNKSSCFKPKTYPKSESQNFLKNLHAFLNIKQILQSMKISTTETAKEELRKKALDLALKNNFVTELTSLVVIKPDEDPVINKLVTDLFTEDDLLPISFSASYSSSSLSSKRNKINRPSAVANQNSFGFGSFFPRFGNSPPISTTTIATSTTTSITTSTGISTTTNLINVNDEIFDFEEENDVVNDVNNSTSIIGCSLKLFSKPYYRGDSLEITKNMEDLEDFDDKAVTATLNGSCCWDIFGEQNFEGTYKTLKPSIDYIEANSFGLELFRNVSSVARNEFCIDWNITDEVVEENEAEETDIFDEVVDVEEDNKEEDVVLCSIKLFSKTYYRGDSLELTKSKEDLEDFDNKAVTAKIVGPCCWYIFEEKNFDGRYKELNPSFDYIGANSFGSELFRKVSSVERSLFCN